MHNWIQERVSETVAVPTDSAPTHLHIFCTKSFQRFESWIPTDSPPLICYCFPKHRDAWTYCLKHPEHHPSLLWCFRRLVRVFSHHREFWVCTLTK